MELSVSALKPFENDLKENEKSPATIEKYMRDVRVFFKFLAGRKADKRLVLDYKAHLSQNYAVRSANSMIASLNAFLRFCERQDLCVKQYKLQREVYCSEEKELTKTEYIRLVKTAAKKGKQRIALILETICGTGIRVSELEFITVESLKKGEAVVACKGKRRVVFLVPQLRAKLQQYAKAANIRSGPLFLSRTGKPINRTTVWREMKALCVAAAVSAGKVFPHNLRHLFARTFYHIEKDIAKLADILGHSNINTTRIYIISTGKEHRRRMEHMRLII